jgi:hypothetical protein
MRTSSCRSRRRSPSGKVAKRRSSAAHNWRAHEDLVGLALDRQELREAERAVDVRRRRLRELEEQVGEEGQQDSDGDESEGDESEGDESEGDESEGDESESDADEGDESEGGESEGKGGDDSEGDEG